MSDLQRRDQKSCSALIGYASPLLHMTPCDVVDVKVELALVSVWKEHFGTFPSFKNGQ